MHLPTAPCQVSNYLFAVVIKPLNTDDAYMCCLTLACLGQHKKGVCSPNLLQGQIYYAQHFNQCGLLQMYDS